MYPVMCYFVCGFTPHISLERQDYAMQIHLCAGVSEERGHGGAVRVCMLLSDAHLKVRHPVHFSQHNVCNTCCTSLVFCVQKEG